ncbi:hypothetical protein BMS3Bbin14_00948 [bacterium BMS3Bbin14]|nr:hypothetical protein BMS3Bbin14_00948 [bacterium BMS3Bbin14]
MPDSYRVPTISIIQLFATEENNYERHHRHLSVLRREESDTRR